MAMSDVMKLSVVAMFGWIIPLPFAIPPRVHVTPSMSNRTATCLSTVSVVMIAFAALALPSAERPSASSFICFSNGSIGMICPMTPVEALMTRFTSMPRASAASWDIFSAFSIPSALHVLAFLEFTMTACALLPDFFRCSLVTVTGAPFTLFCVYTPAATHGTSENTIPRSFLFLSGFSPQLSPFAVKPFAAHTPPSTYV